MAAGAGQEAAEWSRSICGALGIEGSPRFLYAAAFLDLLARVAERISADPPRKDFTVSTHVRARFATPARISTDAPFERLALEAAEAADAAEAHLAAHLRAFERFQGAVNAGASVDADQRLEEARSQARMSSRPLRRLTDVVTAIADHPYLAQAQEPRSERSRSGRPGIDEVSQEAQALLFLGGLRIRDLENVLRGTRLSDSRIATERLPLAADRFRRLGDEMEEWSPPEEPDLVL